MSDTPEHEQVIYDALDYAYEHELQGGEVVWAGAFTTAFAVRSSVPSQPEGDAK